MAKALDKLSTLARKGWSIGKAKEIISNDLALGSSDGDVSRYIEKELNISVEEKCIHSTIIDPVSDQVIPAGEIFTVEFIDVNGADEVFICYPSLPKGTGFVKVVFFLRGKILVDIKIENRGKIA